ncbi:hypothetical protein MASR1M32_10480 [Rhodobacter sp.]
MCSIGGLAAAQAQYEARLAYYRGLQGVSARPAQMAIVDRKTPIPPVPAKPEGGEE